MIKNRIGKDVEAEAIEMVVEPTLKTVVEELNLTPAYARQGRCELP